jgi:hypothetical protein
VNFLIYIFFIQVKFFFYFKNKKKGKKKKIKKKKGLSGFNKKIKKKGGGYGFVFCGFAAYCFFILMIPFTDQLIRRNFYELFQYTHLLVYPGNIFCEKKKE